MTARRHRGHSRRLRPPHKPLTGFWCFLCRRDGFTGGGCSDFDIRGRSRVPHTWPADSGIADSAPCRCGALSGELHHYACSLEVCPWAAEHPDDGEQLLCCGCKTDNRELDEPGGVS